MIALDTSLKDAMDILATSIRDARRTVNQISRSGDNPTALALCTHAAKAETAINLDIKYIDDPARAIALLTESNAELVAATASARAGTLVSKPDAPIVEQEVPAAVEALPAELPEPHEDEWIIGIVATARFKCSTVTLAKWIKDGKVRSRKGPGHYSKLLSVSDLEAAIATMQIHKPHRKLILVERTPEILPPSAMASQSPQLVEREKINVFRETAIEFATHDPKPDAAPVNIWVAWELGEIASEGGVA